MIWKIFKISETKLDTLYMSLDHFNILFLLYTTLKYNIAKAKNEQTPNIILKKSNLIDTKFDDGLNYRYKW